MSDGDQSVVGVEPHGRDRSRWIGAADYHHVPTVVTRRFGASVSQVFPGFTPTRVGVMN